jgi:hypothetical protein
VHLQRDEAEHQRNEAGACHCSSDTSSSTLLQGRVRFNASQTCLVPHPACKPSWPLLLNTLRWCQQSSISSASDRELTFDIIISTLGLYACLCAGEVIACWQSLECDRQQWLGSDCFAADADLARLPLPLQGGCSACACGLQCLHPSAHGSDFCCCTLVRVCLRLRTWIGFPVEVNACKHALHSFLRNMVCD